MKILTKYILPAALVAGFLFYFFSDAFNRHFSLDDCFYDGLVRKYGVWGSVDVCYKIANGRWFSHIVCAFSFYFIKQGFFLYGVYLTFLLSLFVLSVNSLYKNYCRSFLNRTVSFSSGLIFSLMFTASLYFLLFEGRWEIWGWIAAANTHLLSVTLCLFLFSLLLMQNPSPPSLIPIFILSAFIGGLNEVNAICTVLTIVGLSILNKFSQIKLSKLNLLLAVLTIAGSLLININSGGYKLRMEGLPDFNLLQSLKNTLHTFAMPILQYKFLPQFLVSGIVFFLYLKHRAISLTKTHFLIVSFSVIVVCISFFLHCYTLSDVVPSRGAIWVYCYLLFLFSLIFISSEPSPEK